MPEHLYSFVDKASTKSYPQHGDSKPNLLTYLDAINNSQPIVQSQFELVYSRWPRTIFFTKGITIPGISTNYLDISHAGFTINISCNPKYESNEISFTIIADKEGYHYYDWRNMVLQGGHPLTAGDTQAQIGKRGGDYSVDNLEIRLRNSVEDKIHHHWIVHNFRPVTIGDIELGHDSSGFVEFEITGTFTHISYDAGFTQESQPQNNNDNGENDSGGDSGSSDGEQGNNDKPEDWEFMSDNDKKAWEMMKNGMSEDEALQAMKDSIKEANPDISDDDLDAQATAAIQNATAAGGLDNGDSGGSESPNLSESEQAQFNNEFSNSKPEPSPEPSPTPQPPQDQPSQDNPPAPEPPPQQTEKTQIAGEDFNGSLSDKQMATMEMAMAMGNTYPPEVMNAYNAQKAAK